ncbi:hypothetical protein KBC79_05945 [Candidatus Woesebacteria bacterium]|nr:hypothetical protein [Candidatus Woesebacteria bacterium]
MTRMTRAQKMAQMRGQHRRRSFLSQILMALAVIPVSVFFLSLITAGLFELADLLVESISFNFLFVFAAAAVGWGCLLTAAAAVFFFLAWLLGVRTRSAIVLRVPKRWTQEKS